jgi:hypothetical protein
MKGIKVEVKGKEYILGFENRKSVRRAESLGVNILSPEKIATFSDDLFYAAILDKQPNTTRAVCEDIIQGVIDENGINYYNDVVLKLSEFLRLFYGDQADKSEKKIEIVEM